MINFTRALGCAAAIALATSAHAADLPQSAIDQIAEADLIAGDDRLLQIMRTYHCYYVDPEEAQFRPKVSDQTDFLFGTKILDNVYYLGYLNLAAYAVESSEGLILIDAGNTDEDGQRIVDWMTEAGFAPSDLHTIIITHEHGDHYNGLPKLRAFAPEARVVASQAAEWDEGELERIGPIDMEIDGRTELDIGDTEIVLLPTPGHTPGTISVFSTVEVDGERQVAAFWGGKGMRPDVDQTAEMLESVKVFAAETEALQSYVPLNTHSWGDATISRLIDHVLMPDAPNAFLMTPAQANGNMQILEACTGAYLDAVKSGAIKPKG